MTRAAAFGVSPISARNRLARCRPLHPVPAARSATRTEPPVRSGLPPRTTAPRGLPVPRRRRAGGSRCPRPACSGPAAAAARSRPARRTAPASRTRPEPGRAARRRPGRGRPRPARARRASWQGGRPSRARTPGGFSTEHWMPDCAPACLISAGAECRPPSRVPNSPGGCPGVGMRLDGQRFVQGEDQGQVGRGQAAVPGGRDCRCPGSRCTRPRSGAAAHQAGTGGAHPPLRPRKLRLRQLRQPRNLRICCPPLNLSNPHTYYSAESRYRYCHRDSNYLRW